MLLILILLLVGYPKSSDREYIPEVDKIEINQYLPVTSEDSTPTFTQVIFWTWYIETNSFHVRDWVMLETVSVQPKGNGAIITFVDGSLEGKRIKTKLLSRTTTPFDPEREDQKKFPQKLRKGVECLFDPIPKELLEPILDKSPLQTTINP